MFTGRDLWPGVRKAIAAALCVEISWAALKLTTRLVRPLPRHDYEVVPFAVAFLGSAVTYSTLAVVFLGGACVFLGYTAMAWIKETPKTFREFASLLWWSLIAVVLGLFFSAAAVAWIIEPFVPSVSNRIWALRF
jgi:hypothetical protein